MKMQSQIFRSLLYNLKNVYIDLDGNKYRSIIIGNWEILTSNLKVTKYADGSTIPNLTENSYSDWFLPSKDELALMRTNLYLYGVGDLNAIFYWSSSEATATNAFGHFFSTGTQSASSKAGTNTVRACRKFTAAIGAYSLRDTGPTGGLIFYVDGTTYYEAAPGDQGNLAWSNITNILIGTTGTAIGTGQSNTNLILSQSSTAPSAKTCNDLSEGGWVNDTLGAMCFYNNDPGTFKKTYGGLYNRPAITNTANGGLLYFTKLGVEQPGWIIPSRAQWQEISDLIGGDSVSGGKLKEIGTIHWGTPNVGATDEYGFRGVGNGYRGGDGLFSQINTYAWIWNSTWISPFITARNLLKGSDDFQEGYGSDNTGFAVRCIRNTAPIFQSMILTSPNTIRITYSEALNESIIPALGDYVFDWQNDIIDLDGNVYTSVDIGSQRWIVENLKVTKYADGSTIPNITDNTAWAADTAGAMCFYNNDEATYKATYGGLYNWPAATNVKGLAKLTKNGIDQNYRVATSIDLLALSTFLGGGEVSGGKLKETGLTHWNSPNTGATNESGFTALGTGYRSSNGGWSSLGVSLNLWSSTNIDTNNAWQGYVSYNNIRFNLASLNKKYGIPIRLVKDI